MKSSLHIMTLLLVLFAGMIGCESSQSAAARALQEEVIARRTLAQRSLILYQEGVAARTAGKLDVATEKLQLAIDVNERNAAAWLAFGIVHQEQGRLYEAAEAYDRASSLAPTRYEPKYNLGILFEQVGYLERAIESYEQALDLAPGNLHVQENLARSYIKAEQNHPRTASLIQAAKQKEFRPDWRRWLQMQSIKLSESAPRVATPMEPSP